MLWFNSSLDGLGDAFHELIRICYSIFNNMYVKEDDNIIIMSVYELTHTSTAWNCTFSDMQDILE